MYGNCGDERSSGLFRENDHRESRPYSGDELSGGASDMSGAIRSPNQVIFKVAVAEYGVFLKLNAKTSISDEISEVCIHYKLGPSLGRGTDK